MRKYFRLNKMFSKDIVNTGRQIEVDLARGLAVLFMVLVHVQMYFSNEKLEQSVFGNFIDFFGGIPAAPVFMFLMGLGFLYSKNTDYRLFLKRGAYILFAGYILNFLRESLPAIIDYLNEGKKEDLTNAIEGFVDIDILQFAGLTMIFFGLFKWLRLKWWMILNFVLIFSSLNYALQTVRTDAYVLSAITGLFWGSSEYSEFPFLTWIFYPILGYVFAHILMRCKNKKLFYRFLMITSIVATLICFLLFKLVFRVDLGMESDLAYYHHNIFGNIVYGLFVISWLSCLFLLVKYIPAIVLDQFKRWSRNVTEIYFFHWILIGWLEWYFYPQTFGLIVFGMLMIMIFLASDGFSYFLNKKHIKLF